MSVCLVRVKVRVRVRVRAKRGSGFGRWWIAFQTSGASETCHATLVSESE